MQLEAWLRAEHRTRYVVARQCFVPITSRLSPLERWSPVHNSYINGGLLERHPLIVSSNVSGSGSKDVNKLPPDPAMSCEVVSYCLVVSQAVC